MVKKSDDRHDKNAPAEPHKHSHHAQDMHSHDKPEHERRKAILDGKALGLEGQHVEISLVKDRQTKDQGDHRHTQYSKASHGPHSERFAKARRGGNVAGLS